MKRNKLQQLHRELSRLSVMVLMGLALIHFTPELALLWGIPAISPWGLFIGGLFLAAAVSHVMRRLLFPSLDLQAIATRAVGPIHDNGNLPAAIVFASICAILGLLLYLNASLLRLQ